MITDALASTIQRIKAVFVLGGTVRPKKPKTEAERVVLSEAMMDNDDAWQSPVAGELTASEAAIVPSYERNLAAYDLFKMNNRLKIVTSGGRVYIPDLELTSGRIARIMSRELQELGVPATNIQEETDSLNTQDQLILCASIAWSNKWKGDEIAILSNLFHHGRIIGMLVAMPEKTRPFVAGITPLLSVERVLGEGNPVYWNSLFADLYKTPAMIQLLADEAIGVGQLLSGHSPTRPRPYRDFADPLETQSDQEEEMEDETTI